MFGCLGKRILNAKSTVLYMNLLLAFYKGLLWIYRMKDHPKEEFFFTMKGPSVKQFYDEGSFNESSFMIKGHPMKVVH